MSPKWHLSYANGYIALGLLTDAENELRLVPEADRTGLEFLQTLATLLQEQKRWRDLLPVARTLVEQQPESPGGWIMWAYATRRATSIAEAEEILLRAEQQHPGEATLQYNLGCYACQRGDLQLARVRLDRAIAIEPSFRHLAQTDPDYAPLREASSR